MEPTEASGGVIRIFGRNIRLGTDAWVGVDFDGVLAHWDPSAFPALGHPIALMVEHVRRWIDAGIHVRIFTARVSHIEGATGEGETVSSPVFVEDQRREIEAWCQLYLGCVLPVTCVKDFKMVLLIDDRCVEIVTNTGMSAAEEAAL